MEKAGPSKIKFANSNEEDDHQSEDDDSQIEDDDNQSSSEEEEEDLEAAIKRTLADVPMGELHQERSNGFHAVPKKNKGEMKVKRKNKNRPMEMSSKKPVGRFREVIQVPKKVARDPRFESLSGELDTDGFRKRYDFLFESKLPAEKEELRKLMKKSKDPKVIADLKSRISSIDKQLKAGSVKRTDADILRNHKKKEREAAKQGKQPYYLKRSDLREQSLIEQYNQLKASGKLEKFLKDRRKKNAAKDHRYMPYRRPGKDDQPE
ncbi:ribosomal RNA processing protein 36 homolog [Papaver somniferum]|uniref:ribosomal RNA processing protein 36 homolog n=1 Tax=Papaver somniferum TaxID=3469 RepID=UPI000E6F8268|nr:ribosomal RNA processing protein 36 homolog [Papaver somniferum]